MSRIAILSCLLLSGCASVALERTDQGLSLQYSSFLKKLEAPSVQVTRPNDYSASFNAESSAADPMAAMMMQMFERSMCLANPALCAQ